MSEVPVIPMDANVAPSSDADAASWSGSSFSLESYEVKSCKKKLATPSIYSQCYIYFKLILMRRIRHPALLILEVLVPFLLLCFFLNKKQTDVDKKLCPSPPISLISVGHIQTLLDNLCSRRLSKCVDTQEEDLPKLFKFLCLRNMSAGEELQFVGVDEPLSHEANKTFECDKTLKELLKDFSDDEKKFIELLFHGKAVIMSTWPAVEELLQEYEYGFDESVYNVFLYHVNTHDKFVRACKGFQTTRFGDNFHSLFCGRYSNISAHEFRQILYLIDFIHQCEVPLKERFILVQTENELNLKSFELGKEHRLWAALEIHDPNEMQGRLEITRHVLHIPEWLRRDNDDNTFFITEMMVLDFAQKLALQGTTWFLVDTGITQLKMVPPSCKAFMKKVKSKSILFFPSAITLACLPTVIYFGIVAHFELTSDLEDQIFGLRRMMLRIFHLMSLLADFLISVSLYSMCLIVVAIGNLLPGIDLIALWVAMLIYIAAIAVQNVWFAPFFMHLFKKKGEFLAFSALIFLVFYCPGLCQDFVPIMKNDALTWISGFLFPQVAFSMVARIIVHLVREGKEMNFQDLYTPLPGDVTMSPANFILLMLLYTVISCICGIVIRKVKQWDNRIKNRQFGSTLPPTVAQAMQEANQSLHNNSDKVEKRVKCAINSTGKKYVQYNQPTNEGFPELIIIQNMCERAGNYRIFNDVTFRVYMNDCVCIAGLSEERVKYLFLFILGQRKPQNGTVEIDPSSCPKTDRIVEYKSRHTKFVPELTVLENIHFFAALRGYSKESVEVHVKESTTMLGLDNSLDEMIDGTDIVLLQKVSLIACFSGRAFLYLLDNPTHGIQDLDEKNQILSYLQWMYKTRKITIIMTINDLQEAVIMRSRLFVFTESGLFDVDRYKRVPTNLSYCLNIIMEMNPLAGPELECSLEKLTERLQQFFNCVYLDKLLTKPEKLFFCIPYPFEKTDLVDCMKDMQENASKLNVAAFYLHEPNIQETTLNALYNYPTVNKNTKEFFISYCTSDGIKPKPPSVNDIVNMPNLNDGRGYTRNMSSQTHPATFVRWLDTTRGKKMISEAIDRPASSPESDIIVEKHRDLDDSNFIHCMVLRHTKLWLTFASCIQIHLYEFRCAKCVLLYILVPCILLFLIGTSQSYQSTGEEEVKHFDSIAATSKNNKLILFIQQDQQQRSLTPYGEYNDIDFRLKYATQAGFASVFTANCRRGRCNFPADDICVNRECSSGSLFVERPKGNVTYDNENVHCNCSNLNVFTANQSLPPMRIIDNNIHIYDLTYRNVMKWLLEYQNVNGTELPITYGMQLHVGLTHDEVFETCIKNMFKLAEWCIFLHYLHGTFGPSATLWYNPDQEHSAMLALTAYNNLLADFTRNSSFPFVQDRILETHEKVLHHPIIDMFYKVEFLLTAAFLPAFVSTMFLLWISSSQLSHILRHRFCGLSHLHFLYQRTEGYYWLCNFTIDLFHYIFTWGLLCCILLMFKQWSFISGVNIITFFILSVCHGACFTVYGYIWVYKCRPSDHHHVRIIFIWLLWLSVATLCTLLIYYTGLMTFNTTSQPNVHGYLPLWISFAIFFPPFVLCHGLFVLALHHNIRDQSTFMISHIPSSISFDFCGLHMIMLGFHVLLSFILLWLYRTKGAYFTFMVQHKKFKSDCKEEESDSAPIHITKLPSELIGNEVILPYIREKVFVVSNVKVRGRRTANMFLGKIKKMAMALKMHTETKKSVAEKVYNITIRKGSCVALVGPAKSDKSKILRVLGGINKPKEGKCYVLGNDISIYGICALDDVAFCPKQDQIMHCAHPKEFLDYFYKCFCSMDGEKGVERRKWMMEVVSKLRLNDDVLSENHPGSSVRRKVMIAATVMLQRHILLFDEPFYNLEKSDELLVKKLFESLQKEHETTIVFTCDEISHCHDICDEVYLMNTNMPCLGGGNVKQLYLQYTCGYFIECFFNRNSIGRTAKELQVNKSNHILLFFMPKKNENLIRLLEKLNQMKASKHLDDYILQHGSYQHMLWQQGKDAWNISDKVEALFV
jgi:ABC-type multidrug transport system ATPase subunit